MSLFPQVIASEQVVYQGPSGVVKHNEFISMNPVLVFISELVKSSENGGL